MINSLSIEVQCDSNLGVIDEIIHSGKLSIFSNDELKFLLSSWSGILYRVRLQEQELLNMRSRTIEMVRNKANLRLGDRKSTRLNSSHVAISYAVFCLKKKIKHH